MLSLESSDRPKQKLRSSSSEQISPDSDNDRIIKRERESSENIVSTQDEITSNVDNIHNSTHKKNKITPQRISQKEGEKHKRKKRDTRVKTYRGNPYIAINRSANSHIDSIVERQNILDFEVNFYQKQLIDALKYHFSRELVRLTNDDKMVLDDSVEKTGGICSSTEIKEIDKALVCALFLGKAEINHDFLGTRGSLTKEKIEKLRNLFDVLTRSSLKNFMREYGKGSEKLKKEYDFLMSIYRNSDPSEWDTFSKTFIHILENCPEEIANWSIYKYKKIYDTSDLDAKSTKKLDEFRKYLSQNSEYIIAIDEGEDAFKNTTKFFILVDSNFMPVYPVYDKSILVCPVDATFKTSLLLPLVESRQPEEFTVNGISVNVKKFKKSDFDAIYRKIETAASLADPSASTSVSPADSNMATMFDLRLDTGLEDNKFAYAFLQSCLIPNYSHSAFFTGILVDLYNTTFFELFGSKTRIQPIEFSEESKNDFVDLILLIQTKKPKTYKDFKNIFIEFYENKKGIKRDQVGSNDISILFTPTDHEGDFLLPLSHFFSSTENKTPYGYTRLKLNNSKDPIYIGFKDFTVDSISECVNALSIDKKLSLVDLQKLPEWKIPSRGTAGSSFYRLVSLAAAIYNGITITDREQLFEGKSINQIFAGLIITFKARGDSNQVSFLAMTKDRLQKSELDKGFVSFALRTLGHVLTNDKHTQASSQWSNLSSIRGGAGINVNLYDMIQANGNIRFYSGDVIGRVLEGTQDIKFDIDSIKNKMPEVDTNLSVTVTLEKSGNELIIMKQICGIFYSMSKYYELQSISYPDSSIVKIFNELQLAIDELIKYNKTLTRDNYLLFLPMFVDSIYLIIEKFTKIPANDLMFTFKTNFLLKIKAKLDELKNAIKSGNISETQEHLKILYKQLFSAQQCFDILSEKSINYLNEQESILITDFEYMQTLLTTDKVSQQVISKLGGVKQNAMEYIFGKKVSIIQDALKSSRQMFVVPDRVKESMINLISGSNTGKQLFLDLTKRVGANVAEIEEKKKGLRTSNRAKVRNDYSNTDTDFKIVVGITQLEGSLSAEFKKVKPSQRTIKSIQKKLEILKQKQMELIIKKNNEESKITATFRTLQDINTLIEESEDLFNKATESTGESVAVPDMSIYGQGKDSNMETSVVEGTIPVAVAPMELTKELRSNNSNASTARSNIEYRNVRQRTQGGSKKRKTRKLYRNKKYNPSK